MLQQLRTRFIDPGAQYSPIPFWFWNDSLTKEELLRQIHDFHVKEVEGFVLHPRIGIPESMPYLSEPFMDLVEAAVEEAAALKMNVILYDEGMYPSGAANGEIVRRNPEYASRGLRMVEQPLDGPLEWTIPLEEGDRLVSVQAIKKLSEKQCDVTKVHILKAEDGRVRFAPPDQDAWSLIAFIDSFTNGTIRGIHYGQDDGEPNAPRAADLLNPEAIALFIELTHERYYQRIGKHFGSTVIAMFTDEPDLLGRRHRKGLVPWTNGFLKQFLAGGNREEELAALWFDVGIETESIKTKYRKAVRKQMEKAYYKPLHDWCEERGIALTGHPAASDDIGLLQYFHIPGQDVVWRWLAPENELGITGRHSTMGKCSSDAARHRGRARNLNECFGVCGKDHEWALTADDMKWYLDWLFVRGVNLITPHAFYYSIEGERLHERAPDVGPNNIWWSEYARFARYIKRMSWVMTDSVNVTRLAVLSEADHLSWKLAKPLFERQIEFNYLEEELLQNVCTLQDGKLSIVNQVYDTIILEQGREFEAETWSKLEAFVRQGGIVAELTVEGAVKSPEIGQQRYAELDQLVDSMSKRLSERPVFKPAASNSAQSRAEEEQPGHADQAGMSQQYAKGLRISHVVKDGVHLYVLVNEGEAVIAGHLTVQQQGWAEVWDAWNGTVQSAEAVKIGEGLEISVRIERRGSLIIAVDPRLETKEYSAPSTRMVRSLGLHTGWKLADRGVPVVLESWTEWDGMEHFSGTLSYEVDIEWNPSRVYADVVLDLGQVHELARVFLNGEEVGIGMWKPYRFSIHEQLREGVNRLRVDVTNTLANRYDKASLPSGLIGPVILYCYE